MTDAVSAREDARLIAQSLGGNQEAFEALYLKYKGQVYRTALAVTRDRDAAEDILQECFLRVHAYLDRLDGDRTIAPWLYRVTVNLSYNWLSRGRRQVSFLDDALEQLMYSHVPSAYLQLERGEQRHTIMQALDELSFAHRTVVVLFYLNDFSLEEIAYVLECPVGTVKSRLYYAREKLRRRLVRAAPALGEVAI